MLTDEMPDDIVPSVLPGSVPTYTDDYEHTLDLADTMVWPRPFQEPEVSGVDRGGFNLVTFCSGNHDGYHTTHNTHQPWWHHFPWITRKRAQQQRSPHACSVLITHGFNTLLAPQHHLDGQYAVSGRYGGQASYARLPHFDRHLWFSGSHNRWHLTPGAASPDTDVVAHSSTVGAYVSVGVCLCHCTTQSSGSTPRGWSTPPL